MTDITMNRRMFGKGFLSCAGAAAFGCFGNDADAMSLFSGKKESVGLQLYSLRELTKIDFSGTVRKVAEIGYDSVEFAGYGGMTAKEVNALLDDCGMVTAGTHEGFGNLGDKLDATIEFNLGIGCPNIVCPSMPGEFREAGADGFKRFGEQLSAIGEKVKATGMNFLYHNHSFEFKEENGRWLFDSLLEAADPENVKLEVDIYWVLHGGVEPADFIRKHGERVAMLHMKDMAADDKSYAPVGTGILDFPSVITAARESGIKWFVVEQDRIKRPPMEAISISEKNMRKLLG